MYYRHHNDINWGNIGDFNANFELVFVCCESRHQNNLSKSWELLREIFVMEFRYSETIFFGIYSNFTFDSETYDIVKLDYDSLKPMILSNLIMILWNPWYCQT